MGFRTVRARLAAVLTILAIFSAGVFVFVQSAAAAEGIFRGLTLCAEIIIPSLFVFMALCSFIIKSGAARILGNIFGPAVKLLFNLPKCAGPALLMSAAGGYPIGVRSAYELYKAGDLSKLQAGRTALIAVNAGPAFIVGAVGEGMLLNRKSGFILLFAHLLSSLLLGIFSGIIWRGQDRAAGLYPNRLTVNPAASTPQNKRPASLMDSFVDSVTYAAKGIFYICIFVVLFSGILGLISSAPLPETLKMIISCVLEVTSGCSLAAGSGSLVLLAATLGFSSFSVIAQIFCANKEIMPPLPLFILYRVLHAGLSALLTLPFAGTQSASVEVFSTLPNTPIPANSVSLPVSAALIVMCSVLLASFGMRKTRE